ncbi:MAG: (Fe-S)-binding protein [Acidimicrobiia bacterium]
MTAQVWRTDFAPTTAELNACVACGLCLPHCPTFRLTGLETASPRGRLAAMRGVAEGVIAIDDEFEEAMSFCLNCRACEAVCPSMVPFGRAMEGARAEVAAAHPTVGRGLRHFVLGRVIPNRGSGGVATQLIKLLQKLGPSLLREGPAQRSLRGLRGLQARPRRAQIVNGPRVGLLVGCVMDKWFGNVNQAAIELLDLAGYQVVTPASQTCCGALAVHDGNIKSGRRLAAANVAAFASADVVVATAAGCSAHLKGYDKLNSEGAALAAKTLDITELIARLIAEGALPRLPVTGEAVVVHDPCHLRHAQRITSAPREILAAAGLATVDADPDGICCGAAGIYSLTHPEASHQLGERIAALAASAATTTLIASANPGCEMQLRSHLPKGYRVAHPVELYLESIRSSSDHVLL